MSAWFALLIITFGNLCTGYFAWRLLDTTHKRQNDGVATLVASFALGTAINGWVAITLAETGQFKPLVLLLSWIVLTTTLGLLAHRQNRLKFEKPQGTVFSFEQILLLLWLPLACFLFFRPHHFVQGAADAGVYVNLAANLAETGRLQLRDSTLATLDPDLYPNLLRQAPAHDYTPFLYKLGFYFDELGTGNLIPQFYPQHPVWQAIAYQLGGVYAALMLTGLWALFATLALYLLARDLGTTYAHWIALAALSVNAIQVWFARYPTTEMLTQFMITVGLWALSRMLLNERRAMAFLSAMALGIAHFTRIDAIFLLCIPVLLLAWLLIKGKPHLWRLSVWFFLPLGLLTLHTFAHAILRSRPYFLGTFGVELFRLRKLPWLLPTAAGVGLVLCILLVSQASRLESFWQKYGVVLKGVAVFVVLGLAIYGWFIRPNLDQTRSFQTALGGGTMTLREHENLLRLAWYVSPFGIWLGVFGTCWQIWRIDRRSLIVVLVGAIYTLLYLWRIRSTPSQIYSMRRYVPVTLPFLILMASVLLDTLLYQKHLWLKTLGGVLTFGWLVGFVWSARGFVSQVDQVGQIEQIAAISAQLDPNSIVIFNDVVFNEAIGQEEFWGLPLQYLHGHSVYSLREVDTLDAARLQAQLQQWSATDRAIYWMDADAPETNAWPFAAETLAAPIPYAIEFSMLETPQDRKPTAILPIRWSGHFQRVSFD
ncbi:MAG: ArnT family glycosyltransferase [Candidatus Promineifilaceae bacterium]